MPELLRERLALDQLHHQIVGLTLAADVVERADVRVVEARDRARLALEAGADLGVVDEVRRKHLDRDFAAEPRIARAIDLAHAAGAERGEDFVGTEASRGGERHERHRE
jgi:hypothetical protein